VHTLDGMIRGGIRDHLGGGFHRYSTDPRWHLPHFEKMLYDQAMILIALSEAYSVTSKAEYRQVAEEIIEYVERKLTAPEGGFFSSEDADAAGEEGSFYVWTYEELSSLLTPEDLSRFKELYDVWDGGNFRDEATRLRSGKNVLHLTSLVADHARSKGLDPQSLIAWDAALRERLRLKRDERPAPSLDDKVLTDWNGLMIAALCSAYRHLGSEKPLQMAKRALTFVEERLVVDGDLQHRYRQGVAGIPSFLDDHACLAWACLEMYYLSHEARFLERAMGLVEEMISLFVDKEEGGFHLAREDPSLLLRMKDLYDGAAPSGNSIAYYVLVQLAALFDDIRVISVLEDLERHFFQELHVAPSAYTMFMNGVLMKEKGRTLEVFASAEHRFPGYHPHLLTIAAEHMEERADRSRPVYRLCTKGVCHPETEDRKEIEKLLQ